jgi:uncharacterized membrane protein YvbJ
MSNTNEKSCPNCGKWDFYAETDKICKNCGSLMDKNKIIYEDRKKKGLIPKFKKPKPFLQIKAHHPWYYKALLYVIKPIIYVFFLIVSIITYIIVWLTA